MKPSEFASEINDRKIDPAIVLQNYLKIFSEPFLPSFHHQLDMRLVQPELRQQFLFITFDAISEDSDNFMENYSNDMVIEMLNLANAQNKQLSPSLINLLEKLSHTQQGSMSLDSDKMGIAASSADSALSKEQLQKFLDSESYDNYVDKDYSTMLQQLSKEAIHSGRFPRVALSKTVTHETHHSLKIGGSTDSESFMDVFDEEFLDLRITRMILALLDLDLAIEGYVRLTEKLVLMPGHLIDIGAYDVVLLMIQTFQSHAQEKSAAFRLVAEECF
jgi:hypothetical protein